MTFTVVIPARYGSTRLPGKPLLDIAGKPMIQRVYEQALKSDAKQVYVATDDQRVFDCLQAIDANVLMTSDAHESGTDRLQEVATQLSLADDAIVVNVQGDEPLIPPELINQVAALLQQNQQAAIATLAESINDETTFANPNVVKVVCDQHGQALYFSRASIPWPRAGFAMQQNVGFLRHIGIYAYRVALLNEFVTWPVAPIEALECLEQLRAMYHGKKIQVAVAEASMPGGVDTEEDLQRVRAYFAKQ